jgi:hypothetical protein
MKTIAIILASLLTGCATSGTYRPFTEADKQAFARGIAWNCADVITTQVALNNEDIAEQNWIVQELVVDHEVEYMAVKALQAALAYQIAHKAPDARTRALVLRTYMLAGAGPALWNIGVMGSF